MSVRFSGPGVRLSRRREGRWVAGVCAGLATALGVPVGALRAVVGLLALGSLPAVALLYAVAWVFLPPDDGATADAGAGGPLGDVVGSAVGGGSRQPAGFTIDGRPAEVLDAVGVLAVVAGAVLLL